MSRPSSIQPRTSSLARLREDGGVLLVSCYELGHQPMGLASPMAFLERAGYRPDALDLAVGDFDPAVVTKAQFVGISVPMHTALRLGLQVARRVRQVNEAARICFFGHYAALNAEFLLDGVADFVLAGELDQALVDLVMQLESGGVEAGVVTAEATSASGGVQLGKLDFVSPSRSRLPELNRYAQLRQGESLSVAGYVEASRGCLHGCRHCPIPPVYRGRFFVVPVDVLLEDVRQQVAAGMRHLTIGDPDFLNGPGHALRFVRALHAEFPELTYDVTAKVEHLLKHRRHLAELRDTGCLFVVSAVESLSGQVLQILDKGHDRADVDLLVKLMREVGITLRPSLLPFTPWSTLDDHLELLEWVREESLEEQVDPVQLSIRLLVPPGSLLVDHPEMRVHLRTFDPEELTWRWHHPDPRMDELQRRTNVLVSEAATRDADPRITLAAIRVLAQEVAGVFDGESEPVAVASGPRLPAPRLTESWFC